VRSAAEIAELVNEGELDPVAVVDEALQRMAEDADTNAVLVTLGERAIQRARGGVRGRLAGVPLLVKDVIDVAGTRTTFGSRIYADRIAEGTASSVRALEDEGAIVVAKTLCDEFAWGVGGQNPHWGNTHNPLRPGRIAGGSSSGNAAGLALGMGALALGTDTGGSVRLPAAGCGVVGFKPAYGTIPLDGVYPLAPSLDTMGAMARTVDDCALAWSVLTGEPVPEPRLDGKRIGKLVRHPGLGARGEPAPEDPRAAALPGDPVELPVPEADMWPLFYAEAAASHRETYPRLADDYGPVIRAKLVRATRVKPEAEAAARAALEPWRAAAQEDPPVDVIVSPALGLPQLPDIDTPEHEFRIPFSAYARVFNFLGWPAIAIGETQLAARDAHTLLEAALAWGRSGPE